jgi:hypothetical protein
MRRFRGLDGSFYVLGIHVPAVVGLVIGVTLVLTIVGLVGARNGYPQLLSLTVLVPSAIWTGQLWRLLTWSFVFIPDSSLDGLNFVIGCFVLLWVASQLTAAWGARRFLLVYIGFTAAAGAATTLVALVWPSLRQAPHFGPWAVTDALIIAWATLFPYRTVLVFFMVPMSGRNLIYGTIAITVLFALLYGAQRFVPHFLAELFMLAYLRDPSIARLWRRMVPTRAPRRPAHLREVKREKRWGEREPPRWYH